MNREEIERLIKDNLEDTVIELSIDEVIFEKRYYPRKQFNSKTVETYRQNIDDLPPIIVQKVDGVLVDGKHRLEAHKEETLQKIKVQFIDIPVELIKRVSAYLNSRHGKQLTFTEKKALAKGMWKDGELKEDIADWLGVSVRTVNRYTTKERKAKKQQEQETIEQMKSEGHTQQDIADAVVIDRSAISKRKTKDILERDSKTENVKIGQVSKIHKTPEQTLEVLSPSDVEIVDRLPTKAELLFEPEPHTSHQQYRKMYEQIVAWNPKQILSWPTRYQEKALFWIRHIQNRMIELEQIVMEGDR